MIFQTRSKKGENMYEGSYNTRCSFEMPEYQKTSLTYIKHDDVDTVLNYINNLGKMKMWYDGSPIWLRPQYTDVKMYKSRQFLQVVGHTPMETITKKKNVISCDVFSTYRDGKPIGTEEFLLLDTITWDYSMVNYGNY